MDVIEQEISCKVSPSRMFKAIVLDAPNLFPKLVPQSIKSIEFINGDGSPGTIKQITFAEESPFKYLKTRTDARDTQKYACKYTMIEGDALGDKIESIAYDMKFEAATNGGCVCKIITHYKSKGDIKLKQEEIKAREEEDMQMFKMVEEYLLANPNAYA